MTAPAICPSPSAASPPPTSGKTPPGFGFAIRSALTISYFFEEVKGLYFVGRLKEILEPSSFLALDCIQDLASVLCGLQPLLMLFNDFLCIMHPIPLSGISGLRCILSVKNLLLLSGIKANPLAIFVRLNIILIYNRTNAVLFAHFKIIQMKQQSFETNNPDLFSQVRRILNAMKEKEVLARKQATSDLLKIVREEQLSGSAFQEIMMMANKDLLKNLEDPSEANRENSLLTIIELLQRCTRITPFLPYIFAALIDRTNCNDLEGIANLPEKMRPAPGQKPKVIVKLVEKCEEIRMLYCTLMKKILSLVEEADIRDKLDEIVNILRALIMDPSSDIQKAACEALEYFCLNFKLILLHYTEIMGRAVLLPLVSKKSKIRISALNALTAIFWCGLWKYNAFVFQNLIGFRDPNSVPIKDFYEPSNNINYFATFINDQNVKVRQAFMEHLRKWTCELDDKYDHHGRLVPYILSGLFDEDDTVRTTAVGIIEEIGRQIEVEKEKEFRENKQYAIDAAWTWQGMLVDLPVESPLQGRPSLGSRVFVRGHVRKFWTALYKQIKDINFENRIRAARLMVFGTIYTENYMTQYLDVMLPHLLSSIIPLRPEDKPVSDAIYKIVRYLGRYCEVTAYLHIITSALKGELIQNEDFLRASLRGLAALINGAFQSIPKGTGLCHKREQIEKLINLVEQCNICLQIYKSNAQDGMSVVNELLHGLKEKASEEELRQIMESHSLTLIKLLAVSYYELNYSHLIAREHEVRLEYQQLSNQFALVASLYPQYFDLLDSYMRQAYMNPPALMDADWKLIIVIHNFLSQGTTQEELQVFHLAQDVISQSLTLNRSIEILSFLFRYIAYLFDQVPEKDKLAKLPTVLTRAFVNFDRFKPIKKVPVYDQHLIKPETDPTVIRINEDQFLPLFSDSSKMIQAFYVNKVPLAEEFLGTILHLFLKIANKFIRDKSVVSDSIKTLWVVLERAELKEKSAQKMMYEDNGEKHSSLQQIFDFLIERLETMGDVDVQKVNMIFDSLQKLTICCPKIADASVKLPNFYPGYPYLLEKLFKYAMDEKDLHVKQKYRDLLLSLCSKLRPWFQVELRVSDEGRRFARANLLRQILDRAK